MFFSRKRITSPAAPGIAPHDSFGAKPTSLEKTKFIDGIFGVFGAARIKTAAVTDYRAYEKLIEAY